MIIVHTDGGARGNPGPAAIGVVIEYPQNERFNIGKFLGISTNNVAEYTAVLEAMIFLLENTEIEKREEISFFLDSQLVERQITGVYKIKEPKLQHLAMEIKQKIGEWGKRVTFTHVPREQNKEADKIVNETLDKN